MRSATLSVLSIMSIIVQLYGGVDGWAGFKHLSRQKREWLNSIAVKQGLHVERHVAEMRALTRVKRQTSRTCSSGGGGGVGGGGRITVLDTIVVTAPRLSPREPIDFWPRFPRGRLPIGGGGGGGAPPPAPKDPQPTPAPPPKEPPEDKDAKKMTYEQFVYQLEKLETLLKDVPPDQMAHKLRMLVDRYDSTLWKLMLNVNSPVPGAGRDIPGFQINPDQRQTFDQLRQMMEHSSSGKTELGVIKVNGETVALGHVITGATAGYDHQTILGMDNILATTLSGDLGQAGLKNSQDSSSPIIGPSGTWKDGKYTLPSKGGMATNAEILGDIDGFNIGKRILTDKSKSLSQHFKEYYGGESSRRFEIFKGHTNKAALKAEVYKFANLYDYKDAGLLSSVLQNSSPELAVRRAIEIDRVATSAVNAFCTAYSAKLGNWCK